MPSQFDPGNSNAFNNLGGALMRQSRLREAETALREALRLRPDFALPHSNILFCLNYRDDLPPEAIFAEYQQWDARHGRPLAPADPQFALDRTPGRRLRVGYVSPDFRTHAVALFAEPLLAAHDRSQVELFCYAEVPVEDATTQRFRALADHWRSTRRTQRCRTGRDACGRTASTCWWISPAIPPATGCRCSRASRRRCRSST